MTIRCDLIVLSWNSPQELSRCLESLFETVDLPSRLIVVDNASDDPLVQDVLGRLAPRGAIQAVEVLQNERNEGFSRGMNRGLQASTAPYVCLLNNDTVAAPGWLSRLVEVAQAHLDIGILNPDSNTFGTHAGPGGLARHAESVQGRRGEFAEVGCCIGFCLLITRAVIDRIGLLDETLGPFFYEDDDYCVRAQLAGFRCAVVTSAYVFHQEHHSVRRLPGREAIFRESGRRFAQKWGKPLRLAYCRLSPCEAGSSALREVLLRAVSWARRRAFVRVMFPSGRSPKHAAWFASVGLVPHMDVRLDPRRGAALRLRYLVGILCKRKKRFDVIVTDEAPFARVLGWFGWIHGADVVVESATERLQQLWKTRSHSLSSS